ncbi:NAD-dependent succinate-semialdehyde dehydrogenase [uncultured Jatrophihabitans sp.]|uniref:NAD-dependent succinate-semialdehyde dehydrogenase n=1 Tax=uncultured Jatrophihabitans sp. TaxID=1610747 RepID=UPI0035CAD2F3
MTQATSTQAMYKVTDPATNETVAEYATATDAEIQDVLARAAAGYTSWRRTSVGERAAILRRVGELFAERSDDLAAIITREMGKRTKEAAGEIGLASAIFGYYAEQGPGMLEETPLSPQAGGRASVRKEPIGAVLGVMPWNFPYYQVARLAAPNLLLGNTIVLKHAPQCPESALAIETLLHDAGVPADAYVNVFASNEQIADMIADDRIAGASVTGSERAGTAVAETAGRNLKKVILELGGSDAFIVLDGENLDRTVKAGVAGRMQNTGQACNGAKRFIVLDPVYDEFVEKFSAALGAMQPGDPSDPSTQYGPLSSEQAAVTLMEQIEDAVSHGATVKAGGKRPDRPGAYVEPTVLTDVTPEMRAYREELFGPAAVVYRVADVDEAVTLANDSPFGLGGAVFGSDAELAADVADRLDTGMVWINSMQGSLPDLPFGGTKRSGVGRELGTLGIDEFVNQKLIYAPRG